MKSAKIFILFVSVFVFGSCSKDNATPEKVAYFPPKTGTEWETKSVENLGWNQNAMPELLNYLELKNTKGFIILVEGKIAVEAYFNNHTANTNWYWASAGKTLTSTVTGIASQEGYLNLNEKVSDYLGPHWTNMPLSQENLITNKHLLTMTSGINDLENGDCVNPECLNYQADAGTRWAYHNVYVKLQDVISAATQQSFENYFNENLKNKIGMDGSWFTLENNRVYRSTTRSMARFGLLILNNGKWENEIIINADYVKNATSSSQNINKSYGYLWWINGQTSYHLPQSQFEFQGSIIPSGPKDMFMALGKNDQKIYVIPSQKMVVIRMGNAADQVNAALSDFDEILWQKINAVTNSFSI
ncbi:serine hydrolase [Flavobacterium sp.]|uniref:serine hydrolase domain-containing protein n=1 Tax=Flavobacterium sp. TaxID=239 RepID=UPI002620B90F|nr:serine hydrolase [Flavobacterium sp.]MDD3004409.1 serine hydrolase [Flavobacterium sp.]